jgi:hypothetical protein
VIEFLLGVVTAVVVQFLVGFVVDPLRNLKERIGDVEAALIFHANIYMNADAVLPEARADTSNQLRRAASDLLRALMLVNSDFMLRFLRLPPRNDVDEAASLLIGLSNSVVGRSAEENERRRREIRTKLDIDEPSTSR